MKKIIILFLFLFISLAYSAASLRVFEINETQKISLGLNAEDPDSDRLAYTFSNPLDKNGEWQTTYGDAGEYAAAITVSDGTESASENITIIVHRKEETPSIDLVSPQDGIVSINEGEIIKFEAMASDLNNDSLSYKWIVDGQDISEKEEMTFETDYGDSGNYKVELIVSDGTESSTKEWDIEVKDVDLNALLNAIKDVELLETEVAGLELPDFGKYGLKYAISEPIGNDNKWETDYGDSGEYTVSVGAEGNGFSGEKDVKVTVRNKDRKPEIAGLKDISVNENEEVRIAVDAKDPDGESISLSAENIPEGASFEGSIFIWTPSYDFVKKNGPLDYVLDKFRIFGGSVDVIFKASSNALSDEKKVRITVNDANRPFVLEEIENIEVNEGEEIAIDPKYTDPDNDKVSFSYSGFMEGTKKKTGFDDAGIYFVKIIATDGVHSETRFLEVKVNDVNRKPLFNKIEETFEIKEGEELTIVLSGKDQDNDKLIFSADNLPIGAELKWGTFSWAPGFDAANGTEKEFIVDFVVSDGEDVDTKKVKIVVGNVNQAPKIISASNTLIAVKGAPIVFDVNAADEDGDKLTYDWDFGFFDKYRGESKHQRVFASKAKKTVKVTVSDGIEKVSKVWNVEVV